MSKYSPVFTP